MPTLRAQKCAQRRCFSHFPGSYGYEALQGVPLDSLGVSAIEIGHSYAPDRRQRCQEAPKRIPTTLPAFLRFCAKCLWHGGVGGRLYSSQTLRCGWGILKDKIHSGGQKPPEVSTHSPCPTALKLARESNGTPWGSAPSKSGAIMRPIIADVARKRRSAFQATLAAFLCFLAGFLRRGGLWCPLCSFQAVRCGWGALKGKIHAGGF